MIQDFSCKHIVNWCDDVYLVQSEPWNSGQDKVCKMSFRDNITQPTPEIVPLAPPSGCEYPVVNNEGFHTLSRHGSRSVYHRLIGPRGETIRERYCHTMMHTDHIVPINLFFQQESTFLITTGRNIFLSRIAVDGSITEKKLIYTVPDQHRERTQQFVSVDRDAISSLSLPQSLCDNYFLFRYQCSGDRVYSVVDGSRLIEHGEHATSYFSITECHDNRYHTLDISPLSLNNALPLINKSFALIFSPCFEQPNGNTIQVVVRG